MAGIAISGRSGCGASTAAQLVSAALKLRRWNYTFHNLAAEKGITLEELQKLSLSDPKYDYEIDRKQAQFANAKGKFVVASRLAIWLDDPRVLEKIGEREKPRLPLKVWLDVPFLTRVERVAKREGKTVQDVAEFTKKRDDENSARYGKLYGIDDSVLPKDAVMIDASKADAAGVAKRIISLAQQRRIA